MPGDRLAWWGLETHAEPPYCTLRATQRAPRMKGFALAPGQRLLPAWCNNCNIRLKADETLETCI
jgi:hypothetical protein